jgi:hypothetical protein
MSELRNNLSVGEVLSRQDLFLCLQNLEAINDWFSRNCSGEGIVWGLAQVNEVGSTVLVREATNEQTAISFIR